jgi:hypothetical protein
MTPNFRFRLVGSAANLFRLGTAVLLGLSASLRFGQLNLSDRRCRFFRTVLIEAASATEAPLGVAAGIGLHRGSLRTEYAMTLAPDLSRTPQLFIAILLIRVDFSYQAIPTGRTVSVPAVQGGEHEAQS